MIARAELQNRSSEVLMMMVIYEEKLLLLLMTSLSGRILKHSEKEVEEMIKKIQQFDPPGVAARNLQECLLIQLHRKKNGRKKCGDGH